jgi:hypothetical protein
MVFEIIKGKFFVCLFVCLFGFEVIVNFNWIVRATTATENIEKWIESYIEEE